MLTSSARVSRARSSSPRASEDAHHRQPKAARELVRRELVRLGGAGECFVPAPEHARACRSSPPRSWPPSCGARRGARAPVRAPCWSGLRFQSSTDQKQNGQVVVGAQRRRVKLVRERELECAFKQNARLAQAAVLHRDHRLAVQRLDEGLREIEQLGERQCAFEVREGPLRCPPQKIRKRPSWPVISASTASGSPVSSSAITGSSRATACGGWPSSKSIVAWSDTTRALARTSPSAAKADRASSSSASASRG